MNHVIAGVQGVYDRHHYTDEKREALQALASLISRIVGPTNNVVQLDAVRHGAGETEPRRQIA